jgi:hypothetical protein
LSGQAFVKGDILLYTSTQKARLQSSVIVGYKLSMRSKKLSLAEAAEKMADLTIRNLAALTPAKRKRKVQAFKALAAEAASRVQQRLNGKRAISGGTRHTPSFSVAARGR